MRLLLKIRVLASLATVEPPWVHLAFGSLWVTFESLGAFGPSRITGRWKGGFVKGWFWRMYPRSGGTCERSDSVKRHLSRRHLSVLNLKFNFIFNGGCTREEQIALSLKRHLFQHGGRKPKAFWICFSTLPPISNFFQFLELSTKAASPKAAFDTLQCLDSLSSKTDSEV